MSSDKHAGEFYVSDDEDDKRVWLNEFAKRLRNIADDDYIDARVLYRFDRVRGFVYHASQAVEKYLKCILLFTKHPVPTRGHPLWKLYELVKSQANVQLHERSEHLIRELDGLGEAVRYDHVSYSVRYEMLYELDYFVRDIRPYCKGRPVSREYVPLGKERAYLQLKSGHLFRSPKHLTLDGKLEKLLKRPNARDKHARASLIWNSHFFYNLRRRVIRIKRGVWGMNIYPIAEGVKGADEIYAYLSRYIKFHPIVKDHFESKKP